MVLPLTSHVTVFLLFSDLRFCNTLTFLNYVGPQDSPLSIDNHIGYQKRRANCGAVNKAMCA